jgi:general secretion pathway protein H
MRPAPRGFTLLELVVVLAIVAIASGIFVAGIARGGPSQEQEARRLASLLELALAEARASGTAFAWSGEAGGYAFWRRDDAGDWVRFPDTSIYRARALPPGMSVERVALHTGAMRPGERLLLRPAGFADPFDVTLEGPHGRLVVKGSAVGRVTVHRLHAG